MIFLWIGIAFAVGFVTGLFFMSEAVFLDLKQGGDGLRNALKKRAGL